MRTKLMITVAFALALVLFVRSGIVDSLLTFLLSGAVPGTSVQLSPTVMMIGLTAIAWLIIANFAARQFHAYLEFKKFITHYRKSRANMPKRRFGRI